MVELRPEAVVNLGVDVATVRPGAFAPRWTAPCSIEADPSRMSRVGTRAPGRILAVRAQLGTVVRRGDPLLELDTLEYHQVVTEYLTAVARERATRDALERQRQLAAERVGAVADLRRSEADSAEAGAVLHEAEEHLHNLGLSDASIHRLRAGTTHGEARATLRAPMDGRVVTMGAAVGQVVSGTEELFVILRTDVVWATLRIHERDIGRVTEGRSVAVEVPAFPQRVFPGVVSFVGQMVDPHGRTADARVVLNNPDGALRPGMSGIARVQVDPRDSAGAQWVPAEAVQRHESETVVFVEVGTRRYSPRVVEVGEERGGQVPVHRGLNTGDRLVVRGAFALRGVLERDELAED